MDHDPTLGNVYAVLMQFNKSIASFDYALRSGWKSLDNSSEICFAESRTEKLQKSLKKKKILTILIIFFVKTVE